MIAHMTGRILRKSTRAIIIDVGGLGYEVFVPLPTFYALPENGDEVSLHTYTHVREDALVLFGFHTEMEKELFLMLVSVSGIGPRLACNILSGIGPGELVGAISEGNAERLRAIPGVGKKTAERIALELKEKASQSMDPLAMHGSSLKESGTSSIVEDTLSALMNLGYSANASRRAIETARSTLKDVTLERLIKEALRILA